MSAKKKPTITMGIHKGSVVTITKKEAPNGYVVVKLPDKTEVTLPKSIIQ